VLYVCKPWCADWVRLFWPDELVATEPLEGVTTYRPHDTYAAQNAERLRRPRWEHYAAACGTRARLPLPRPLPADALGWARRYRGCVALSPWSSYSSRSWPLTHWLELQRLLEAAGFRVVVLDGPGSAAGAHRADVFSCERVLGEAAARVAALLLESGCLVGNDSGACHVAGMLGAAAVALCGQIDGNKLFGIYPSVKVINGGLPCSGCHWWGPAYRRECDSACASLAAIPPGDVAAAVAGLVRRRSEFLDCSLPRESALHPHHPAERAERYSALDGGSVEEEVAELLAALVRTYKPELVLETGTYLGVAARVLATACRRNGLGRVVTLEADSDRAAAARHALADLSNVTVVCADSLSWLRAYQGPAFGLVVLDTDLAVRVEELRLLRQRGLALGPVFVHDTSRLRAAGGMADCPGYPAALAAAAVELGLPGVECPYSRGWRLFDLGRVDADED
jgi:predicted O-methyltransferase YrrM